MNKPPGDTVLGYFGFPRRQALREARERFGLDLPLVDLDVDRGSPDSGILPATTCRIVANIVDNAVRLGSSLANRPLVFSRARMPLSEKIDRIMATVVDPSPPSPAPAPCEATHGFWGVPPHDFRILSLFPETTHVYGWTRCVEAGRPSDVELECLVDEGVPTVFFTQSFCAKQDLAHYLAERHRGLAVDCHREINDSILAKVEAFVRLSR
jgi:hypothetical protein